jgi:predicted membrane channel-forming protein YqfA (hemolysin III family)
MTNITLFSQIISKLERTKFSKLVKEKQTDKHQKGFNSWTHLVSMLFYVVVVNRIVEGK